MKRIRGYWAVVFSCAAIASASAGCGGADRPSSNSTADASTPSDASAVADATVSGDGTLVAPVSCGVGTWVFNENGDPCGACVQGISDFVTLTIAAGMDAGDSVQDSEGNNWVYDPVACTLTAAGSCNTADTIDFIHQTATCFWTCGGACPACAGQCSYTPF